MNDATQPAALAVIPASSVSTIIAADKGDLLGTLAAKVAAFKPDVSTKAGRDEMRSLAAEVSRTKAELIRVGKGLTETWRKSTKAVNEECNTLEARMDELRDKVRAPLTEYEAREKNRVAAHEAALEEVRALALESGTAAELRGRMEAAAALADGRAWEEFRERATQARADVLDQLAASIAAAERAEAEAAELARFRAEAAERARQDEERRRAEEIERAAAAAAQQAREEAEARAAEAADRERHEAEERRLEVERQRAAAEERAAQLEAEQAAAEERRQREAEEREAERLQEIERRRVAAEDAEREAQRREEAAAAEERRKVAEAQADLARIAEERTKNLAIRKRVNNAAVAALIPAIALEHSGDAAEAEKIAQSIVKAIFLQQIPAVSIRY